MSQANQIDWVYGHHAVVSLIKQSPEMIQVIYVDRKRNDGRTLKLIAKANDAGVKVEYCQRDRFNQQLGQVNHQGVVAQTLKVKPKFQLKLSDAVAQMDANATILVLDGVQDPMNLGACLRVADGANVKQVILPKDKSVSLTATARKVAAGAAESVNLHTVTNLARTLNWLKEQGFWVVGLSDRAEKTIYQYRFEGRTALVMGNEAKGIRKLTADACDQLLSIPMFGQVESLNVASATAVSLYEIVRQQTAQS